MCCKLVIQNSKPCFGEKKHFVNLPVMLENMTWELSLRIIIIKKSIFEVPKNLNYLFAATGLILDI